MNYLADKTDAVILTITANIKGGILRAINMPDEEFFHCNGHDAPPSEGVKVSLLLLQPFRAEMERRSLNYKSIVPEVNDYVEQWLSHRKDK
jgi:hypothetical protein